MGAKWGTFENLTMWKHKTSLKLVLVLAYLKCTYHFRNIGLNPWSGIYYGEFLYWCRINAQAWHV